MNPTSISFKAIAGSTGARSVSLDDGLCEVRLDPEVAAAIPWVISSLLSGDDASPSDLARLCGRAFDAGWRIEMTIGRRRVRLSRTFALRTLKFEVYEDDEDRWRTIAKGAAVRPQFERLVTLPTREMLEVITLATQPFPIPSKTSAGAADDNDVSRLELMSAGDMFAAQQDGGDDDGLGGLELDLSGPSLELDDAASDPEDLQRILHQHRAARTREAIEDQIRGLEDRLVAVGREIGALLDDGEEIQDIEAKLAKLPKVRELTDEEIAVLSDTGEREDDLRRRSDELESQLAGARKGSRTPWFLNPAMLGGLVLAIGATAASIAGGRTARQFALGNIVFLGLALFGALQEIRKAEIAGRDRRKTDAIERRLQQVREEAERIRQVRNRLRGEMQVETLVQYEQVRDRRSSLEQRKETLLGRNQSVLDTPVYKKIAAKKERVELELESRRRAMLRIEDPGVASWELAEQLRAKRIDPEVALWFPMDGRERARMSLKQIASLMSPMGAFENDHLTPEAARAWQKLAKRVTGLSLDGLTLSLDGVASTTEFTDGLDVWNDAQAWAIIETLRLSAWANLVQSRVAGVPKFIVRVHPTRIEDVTIAKGLENLYESIAGSLQVILVRSPAR